MSFELMINSKVVDRVPWFAIFYPSKCDQGVPRFEANLLVVEHEKGYSGVCGKCQNFQQVKYDHQRPADFIQRFPISEWKWRG